jgi:hypothetical protein
VRLAVDQVEEGAAAIRFTVRPRTVILRRGRTTLVSVRAVVSSAPTGAQPAEGAVVAQVTGGGEIRVPWAIAFGRASNDLIDGLQLDRRSFTPSDTSPALLGFDAGEYLRSTKEVRPVARLDLELFNALGDDLGLLARLRDLLPGHYSFALTGRDPSGGVLPSGDYTLRLTAWPTDGGRPTRRVIRFTVRASTLGTGLTPP